MKLSYLLNTHFSLAKLLPVFITQSPEHISAPWVDDCRSVVSSTSLTASVCGKDSPDWSLNHEP